MYEDYAKRRDELGLSNYKVSKDTGIPYSCLADWKSGRSKPKMDKMEKISKYLKISIKKLNS